MGDGLAQRPPQPALTGGGGGVGPTGTLSEDAAADDLFILRYVNPEDSAVDDALSFTRVSTPEDATVSDGRTVPLLVAPFAEDSTVNDLARIRVLAVDSARSGTPDTDPISDGWIDQASTGTNHGNESLLVKGASTVPGSDERRALLQVDLTGYLGPFDTSGNLAFRLSFTASSSNLVPATSDTLSYRLTGGIGFGTSRLFTESTLTWANQPTLPAVTGTIAIAQGAAAVYSFTVDPAGIIGYLGHYLMVEFTLASAAVPNTVTILSRDNATQANRPTYTIDWIQRGL